MTNQRKKWKKGEETDKVKEDNDDGSNSEKTPIKKDPTEEQKIESEEKIDESLKQSVLSIYKQRLEEGFQRLYSWPLYSSFYSEKIETLRNDIEDALFKKLSYKKDSTNLSINWIVDAIMNDKRTFVFYLDLEGVLLSRGKSMIANTELITSFCIMSKILNPGQVAIFLNSHCQLQKLPQIFAQNGCDLVVYMDPDYREKEICEPYQTEPYQTKKFNFMKSGILESKEFPIYDNNTSADIVNFGAKKPLFSKHLMKYFKSFYHKNMVFILI